MPFACAALARHIYHCLKFQEPYQLEKAFGRVLTSHVEDLAKSKFQDDLEGTFRSWMLISLKKRSSNLPYEVASTAELLQEVLLTRLLCFIDWRGVDPDIQPLIYSMLDSQE